MNYQEELLRTIGLKLNNSNSPQDILFFSGAGISVPPPANFPIGNDLHRMLLQYAEKFDPETAEKLSKELIFEQTVSRLSELFQTHDEEVNTFLDAFAVIFGVREKDRTIDSSICKINHTSNDYHNFFNSHILKGGRHFTVNIDQFIESGNSLFGRLYTKNSILEDADFSLVKNLFPQIEGFLLKIHGDVFKDEWQKQGYLYENVQEFDQQIKDILDEGISERKCVIFIGYGGVDEYDITPYFEEKENGSFKNTTALWIQYAGNEEIIKPKKINYSVSSILSKFKNHYVVETTKPEIILNSLFTSIPNIKSTTRNASKNGKEIESYLKSKFETKNKPVVTSSYSS